MATGLRARSGRRVTAALVSDRSDGPDAGIHRFSALEFIARWLDHVPDRYETRVRYYGAYATRRRIRWQRRGISLASVAAAEVMPSEPAAGWPALLAAAASGPATHARPKRGSRRDPAGAFTRIRPVDWPSRK